MSGHGPPAAAPPPRDAGPPRDAWLPPSGGSVTGGGRVSSRQKLHIDKRYLAPVLVTVVLLAGQLTFGFLESWSRTLLAIVTAMAVEVVLARAFTGAWPHLASAYISGISIGMLVRSPAVWPYALCSGISRAR